MVACGWYRDERGCTIWDSLRSGTSTNRQTDMKKKTSAMRMIAGYLPLMAMLLCSCPVFAAEKNEVSPELIAELKSKYDYVGEFADGVAIVWNGDYLEHKAGLVNTAGKEIVPLKYDDIGWVREGAAWVKLNDKYGYINTSGRVIIPCIYDYAIWFNEGYAAVFKEGLYGFIDKNGELITPIVYEQDRFGGYDGDYFTPVFSNGYARVIRDGKYGIVNTNGKEVVPCRYTWMWRCEDYGSLDLIPVELDYKLGYVDLSGKEAIKCHLDLGWGEPFEGDFARVGAYGGSRGAINKKGEVIVPAIYDRVDILDSGNIWVANEGMFIDDFGLYNGNGEMIRPLKSTSKWAGLLSRMMIILCMLIPVSAVVSQLKCSQRRFSFGRILFSIWSLVIADVVSAVVGSFAIITDAVVIIPVMAATIVFVWFVQRGKSTMANISRILVNIVCSIFFLLFVVLHYFDR